MASSSSSRAEHFGTSVRDSDTQNNEESESEDEVTAIERGRQNAETVSLRPSDHIDSVQRVASAWEEVLIEQELRKEAQSPSLMTRRNGKRKAPDPITLSPRPRKRTLRHSSPPPPYTFRHEVETCKGTVVIYLEEIPGESQLEREMRIYEASEAASAEADRDALPEMSSKLISGPSSSLVAASGSPPASVSLIPMPLEVPSVCSLEIYIQAYSMLPKNTILAAYLRTVPGLLYRHSFKTSFPNEDAWSRQEEKKKHHPPLVVTAHDLAMPIHLRVEDSGRYRGDLGIVVDDDFAQVETSHYAQLIVVPRIKYPGPRSSRTRPPKAPIPLEFNLPPTKAWSNFMVSNNTVRGGFVLLVVKLEALDLALRVPDDVYSTFRTIAEGDDLGKIPPLSSWTFETTKQMKLMYWREDLGSLKDGAEGVIQKVGDLVCDVAFKKNGQLVDGDSGVMSVVETELKLANSEGLVTGVFIHPIHGPSVSVWIHASSLIVTLSSHSVVNMSYSQSLSLSNPCHPASVDNGHIPSSTATCDIRDATTVRRDHWKASENVIAGLQTLTPQEHFTKNHRSSCVPWLGIRVYLRSDEEEQQDCTRRIGEVVNVGPDSTNETKFLVLIHWDAPVFGDQLFDWCDYEKFTLYSGTPSWKGVKVKVIKTGVYKNREADVVDVRADPVLDRDTISGISSVYIRFHDGDIVGEKRTAWVDYHYIRRCDTRPMRFLHDSRITGKGIHLKRSAHGNMRPRQPRFPLLNLLKSQPVMVMVMVMTSPYLRFEATRLNTNPRQLLSMHTKLGLEVGTPAANGLYIICNLEPHSGKLARRLQYTKSFSGKQQEDTWLLQIVKWTLPEKGMNHTEELTSEHITTTRDHFVTQCRKGGRTPCLFVRAMQRIA
ncbi:hypothetical protein DFH05DRAFT_1464660 [Lentinula detonsa]|uniref:Uncharacterized protein n=1 Tax=Lentinula detonsa TaxID=2804962 RepID=A0A9W8TSE4_9AGAR|nr:hypothetical protein DFH05DRAFT_1464660 [Lentinula detonsa]